MGQTWHFTVQFFPADPLTASASTDAPASALCPGVVGIVTTTKARFLIGDTAAFIATVLAWVRLMINGVYEQMLRDRQDSRLTDAARSLMPAALKGRELAAPVPIHHIRGFMVASASLLVTSAPFP